MTEGLYSLDTEKALVGAALADNAIFLTAGVKSGDFHDERHAAIWQAGAEVAGHGDYADSITVAERLKRNGVDVPFSVLAGLLAGDFHTMHADSYAKIVRDFSERRRAMSVLQDAARSIGRSNGTWKAEVSELSERLAGQVAPVVDLAQRQTTWTAAELLAAEFPEPRWAVPGIIPVGLSVLAGRPKVGKSWLALQVAMAKGNGGYVLGQHIEPGKVLYLALEDSPRRLQERIRKQGITATAGVTFATSWRRFSDGGLDDLRREITDNGYSLVIVDTLGRALGRVRHDDYGDMTAAVGELQELALVHDVAILAIDHHRKSAADQQYLDPIDEIQGSTAKSGSVDAAIGLFKEQGKRGAVLKVTGRDVEWQELALSWDAVTCCWQLEGTAEEVSLRGRKGDVLNVLRDHYPEALTTKEIAELTGIGANHVSPILQDLVTMGYLTLEPKRGKQQPYALTEQGRSSV
jgi:hypothetical protein